MTNRYVDLVTEGVDLAIRAGDLQDSTLIARKIAVTKRALFASAEYLRKAGIPQQPKDLTAHNCILFRNATSDRWQLINGKQRSGVKVAGAVSADDIIALKELALQGLGIAIVPTFICRDDLAANRLQRVLPGWIADTSAISVVYPAQKFQHPKLKVFIEEIVKFLTAIYGTAE